MARSHAFFLVRALCLYTFFYFPPLLPHPDMLPMLPVPLSPLLLSFVFCYLHLIFVFKAKRGTVRERVQVGDPDRCLMFECLVFTSLQKGFSLRHSHNQERIYGEG